MQHFDVSRELPRLRFASLGMTITMSGKSPGSGLGPF